MEESDEEKSDENEEEPSSSVQRERVPKKISSPPDSQPAGVSSTPVRTSYDKDVVSKPESSVKATGDYVPPVPNVLKEATKDNSRGDNGSSSSKDTFVQSLAERVKRHSAAKIETARISEEKKRAVLKSSKNKASSRRHKGSLKFKISLKGTPSIRPSTPPCQAEESIESTLSTTTKSRERPRENAEKRKVGRIVKPVMPYFTGTAKPLTLLPHVLYASVESALFTYPSADQNKTESSGGEVREEESEKWSRPKLGKGQEYDPKHFEAVKADCPTLRCPELAVLDSDRDELLWERPENPDEYYNLWDDEIRDYLRKCKLLEIPIARSLRHLHAHCGHNVQQAIETIESRAIVLWKPLNEREQSIFESAYVAYGKNFYEIGKYLPHIPVLRIVQHYYKSKKKFQYKKSLLGQKGKKDHSLIGRCSVCNKKSKNLRPFQQSDEDLCEICIANRTELIRNMQMDEYPFGGDFDQEMRFPVNLEGLSQRHAYRGEGPETMYLANRPCEIKELVDSFVLPSFDEVTSILREQQRLRLLGQTGSRLDIARELDDKFDFLKNMCIGELPNREEEIKKMRESTAAKKKECERQFEEILETGILDEAPMVNFKDTPLGEKLEKIKKPLKVKMTEEFSETDYKITLKTFMHYGLDFDIAAEVVRNKTPQMVEKFYKSHKANFDAFLKPYHGKEAINNFKEQMKTERPEMSAYYDKYLQCDEDANGSFCNS